MSTEEGTDTTGAEARIRQLVARVKELEGRVTELTPLAEQADKYRTQIEEVKAQSKAEREALRIEREISSAGITDAEGMEYVQHAYGRLPAEGRPPLAEWLAAKDALPRAVRAYLPEATPAAVPAPTTMTMPKANAGVTSQQPVVSPSAWNEAAIAKMSPSEWKANKAAILASLSTG
jgi:DNA repair exonuclease SbcCD ATPase subunit